MECLHRCVYHDQWRIAQFDLHLSNMHIVSQRSAGNLVFLGTNIDDCSQKLVIQGIAAVAHPLIDASVDLVYRFLIFGGKLRHR